MPFTRSLTCRSSSKSTKSLPCLWGKIGQAWVWPSIAAVAGRRRRLGAACEAGIARRGPADPAALGQHGVQAIGAVDRARGDRHGAAAPWAGTCWRHGHRRSACRHDAGAGRPGCSPSDMQMRSQSKTVAAPSVSPSLSDARRRGAEDAELAGRRDRLGDGVARDRSRTPRPRTAWTIGALAAHARADRPPPAPRCRHRRDRAPRHRHRHWPPAPPPCARAGRHRGGSAAGPPCPCMTPGRSLLRKTAGCSSEPVAMTTDLARSL